MNFPFSILPAADFDVVGFGTNAVDYLIRVPDFPVFNSKIELAGYSVAAGGEVASSMVGLSRLGLKTAYAGRFGDDSAGEIGISSLSAEGIDTTYAEIIKEAHTQVAFILVHDSSGERTVLWHRDTRLAYSVDEAPVEAAIRGRVLHLTPHDVRACIKMAVAAKAAGVIVSADIDNVFDGIEELLPFVDVCLVSSEFSQKMFGNTKRQSALRQLSSLFGCPITGLTLGEGGSLIFCDAQFIETPAFEVPGGCTDTTGAGDAFRAGFLFGMLAGRSVEESAEAANAIAALKCRRVGARSGLPDISDLDLLLKKR